MADLNEQQPDNRNNYAALPVADKYALRILLSSPAEKWAQVMDNPSLVYRKNFLPLRSPLERDLAAYGIQKLVWKKPEQAIESGTDLRMPRLSAIKIVL